MDISQYLIILKGEDRTANVSRLRYQGALTVVDFVNSTKSFNYRSQDVFFAKAQGEIARENKVIHINHRPVNNVDKLIDFGAYVRVIYCTGKQQLFPRSALQLVAELRHEQEIDKLLDYFTYLAQHLGLTNEAGEGILAQEYQQLTSVEEGSVLASYLQAPHAVAPRQRPYQLYYPFGINASQRQAVENAFTAQVSIIQGPPGTGKTQTILNILANALLQDKTVAVVSNNNSATSNILEKLAKQQLDFVAAFLGNRFNKQSFVEKQSGVYPAMEGWLLAAERVQQLEQRVKVLYQDINECLELRNRQAQLEQELRSLQIEEKHFTSYHQEPFDRLVEARQAEFSAQQLLEIWLLCEACFEQGGHLSLWQKIKLWFRYNGDVVRIVEHATAATIASLQQYYYLKRAEEIEGEQQTIKQRLAAFNLKEKITELTELSKQRWKHALAQKYQGRSRRPIFSAAQFKYDSAAFLKEYPLVLSTTYSLKNCLNARLQYDYVIVDEASQVDLLTGVLTLSCAKNIIIVGDLKQLPNVVTSAEKQLVDQYAGVQVASCYNFAQQSLLSSAVAVWQQAPSVLLREHYRCQPQIIDFCNQKFYNGQLLIMTKEEAGPPPLTLYKTPPGNHGRRTYNQREVDVIKQEVLPALAATGLTDVGIIAPYRDQVQLLARNLPSSCAIDTVHKFQGREKEAIILSSVDNELTDFVDDYHMLNVAVSRAVKSLIVVTTGNPQRLDRNYTALAHYIAYHNLQTVESRVHSVFDLLYKGYYRERKRFLAQHGQISTFDSENLLFATLEELFKTAEFQDLDCACHVPLKMLFKDLRPLSAEEQVFVRQPLSHTDFLIYSKVDKAPLLAIEVDGVSFHAAGSKQAARDRKKDHIFALEGLPLLRLRTDGSGEKEAIIQLLRQLRQA